MSLTTDGNRLQEAKCRFYSTLLSTECPPDHCHVPSVPWATDMSPLLTFRQCQRTILALRNDILWDVLLDFLVKMKSRALRKIKTKHTGPHTCFIYIFIYISCTKLHSEPQGFHNRNKYWNNYIANELFTHRNEASASKRQQMGTLEPNLMRQVKFWCLGQKEFRT